MYVNGLTVRYPLIQKPCECKLQNSFMYPLRVFGFCVQFLLLFCMGMPGVIGVQCMCGVLTGFLVFVSRFWGCRFVVFWLCQFSVLPQFCCGCDCVCFVRFCVCCSPCCAGCFYRLYCIVLLFLLACTSCACGGIVHEFFGRLKKHV